MNPLLLASTHSFSDVQIEQFNDIESLSAGQNPPEIRQWPIFDLI